MGIKVSHINWKIKVKTYKKIKEKNDVSVKKKEKWNINCDCSIKKYNTIKLSSVLRLPFRSIINFFFNLTAKRLQKFDRIYNNNLFGCKKSIKVNRISSSNDSCLGKRFN